MCMVSSAHVYPIQFVSNFQVRVDAVFVNVTDNSHVGHSVRGPGALGDEARPVEDGASSHRPLVMLPAHALSRSRVNAQLVRVGVANNHVIIQLTLSTTEATTHAATGPAREE